MLKTRREHVVLSDKKKTNVGIKFVVVLKWLEKNKLKQFTTIQLKLCRVQFV